MIQRQRKSERVLEGLQPALGFHNTWSGEATQIRLEKYEFLTCITMATAPALWCLAVDYRNKSMSTKPNSR